jgi:hypothetical protein
LHNLRRIEAGGANLDKVWNTTDLSEGWNEQYLLKDDTPIDQWQAATFECGRGRNVCLGNVLNGVLNDKIIDAKNRDDASKNRFKTEFVGKEFTIPDSDVCNRVVRTGPNGERPGYKIEEDTKLTAWKYTATGERKEAEWEVGKERDRKRSEMISGKSGPVFGIAIDTLRAAFNDLYDGEVCTMSGGTPATGQLDYNYNAPPSHARRAARPRSRSGPRARPSSRSRSRPRASSSRSRPARPTATAASRARKASPPARKRARKRARRRGSR